jgi:hypothetical protein
MIRNSNYLTLPVQILIKLCFHIHNMTSHRETCPRQPNPTEVWFRKQGASRPLEELSRIQENTNPNMGSMLSALHM